MIVRGLIAAAEAIGVAEVTVRRWVKQKKVHATRGLDNVYQFDSHELDEIAREVAVIAKDPKSHFSRHNAVIHRALPANGKLALSSTPRELPPKNGHGVPTKNGNAVPTLYEAPMTPRQRMLFEAVELMTSARRMFQEGQATFQTLTQGEPEDNAVDVTEFAQRVAEPKVPRLTLDTDAMSALEARKRIDRNWPTVPKLSNAKPAMKPAAKSAANKIAPDTNNLSKQDRLKLINAYSRLLPRSQERLDFLAQHNLTARKLGAWQWDLAGRSGRKKPFVVTRPIKTAPAKPAAKSTTSDAPILNSTTEDRVYKMIVTHKPKSVRQLSTKLGISEHATARVMKVLEKKGRIRWTRVRGPSAKANITIIK